MEPMLSLYVRAWTTGWPPEEPPLRRTPRFELGERLESDQITEAALYVAGQDVHALVALHVCGYFGELGAEAAARSEAGIAGGGPVRSCFRLATGELVWIETAADRSRTAVSLGDARIETLLQPPAWRPGWLQEG